MSDAHQPLQHDGHDADDADLPHEGPIKTPKQLIVAVLFSFVVPVVAIIMLATYVTEDKRPAAGSDGLKPMAVAERIKPVGMVEVKDTSDPASLKTGQQVYAAQCSACHAAGVAGSPKFGDAAAWGPRIAQGYPTLVNSAVHGKGAMGPQAGGDHNEFEVARAVVYMANQGGAKFDEPKLPAAGAATADTGAGTAADATAAAPAAATAAATAAAPATPAAATTAPAMATATQTAAAATPAAAGGAAPALYGQVCSVCHAAGIAGAPKFGDKAAWAPRLAQGIDGLTASAIKGKGAMPPKGGSAASDADIKAVVTYMVGAVK